MQAMVFNIQKMSTEDGPGLRTTIFFKGCPLRCIWCHNPEGINSKPEVFRNTQKCMSCGTCMDIPEEERMDACPTSAYTIIGKEYKVEELLALALADKDFFSHSRGGITLSGGECLMQHHFLREFMPRLRAQGIHIAIDTTGFAPEPVFRDIVGLADLVLYDLKLMSSEEHQRYTLQPNSLILSNARLLGTLPQPVWIRIPVIPGISDHAENIEAIGRFIRNHMPNTERIDLLGYNDLCTADYEKLGLDYLLNNTPRMSETAMIKLKQILAVSGVENITYANCERG